MISASFVNITAFTPSEVNYLNEGILVIMSATVGASDLRAAWSLHLYLLVPVSLDSPSTVLLYVIAISGPIHRKMPLVIEIIVVPRKTRFFGT